MSRSSVPFTAALRHVWTALAVALVLRLLFAFILQAHLDSSGRLFLIGGDADGYWELGQRIAEGQPYQIHQPPRQILRTPGFPLLLAASISVFGDQLFAARIVLAVVATVSCLLVWILARQFTDERTALIAVWIAAIAPLHVAISSLILTESFFTAGVLACLCLVSRVIWNEDARYGTAAGPRRIAVVALIAGVATGVTILIRPSWLLWVPVAVAFISLAKETTSRIRLMTTGLLVCGVIAALLPWAWRNYSVSGHWVVTSLWSGPSLYDGLNPQANGASDMRFLDEDGLYARLGEYEANAEYTRRARQFAMSSPGRALQLAVIKAGRFLSPVLNAAQVKNRFVNIACLAWYACFVAAAVVGCRRFCSEPVRLAFLAIPFGLFLLVHMVFVGSVRYRLPVEMPLSVLAATGVVFVRDRCCR